MELTKSDQKDVACPKTGEPCPALIRMCELYTANASQVEPEVATRDRVLFTVRRTELLARAATTSCEGPDEEVCPTRRAMDTNKVRRGLVSGLRALFS